MILFRSQNSVCLDVLTRYRCYAIIKQLFKKMYPEEEFFPEAAILENSEEDGGLTLES